MALKLDEYDLLLVNALQEDARLSLRDLSTSVGLSAPAIASRLKRLEESGIIEAYRAVIGSSKFGLNLEARILVDVKVGAYDRFILTMDKYLCVTELNKITGAYSFELTASFEDTNNLNAFVEKIESEFGKCLVLIILKREILTRSAISQKLKA